MPRPLVSRSKVMGFATKDETHTPLKTYQNSYDRVGYFVIKTNKERIAKKEADKRRVTVADRVTTRTKPGERSDKEKNFRNSSMMLDRSDSNTDTKQIFFVTPDETSETQPLKFEFDLKNKNVIQLE